MGWIIAGSVVLLVISNVFMNLAWYLHLSKMAERPIFYAILFSWGIAFLEYVLMVPANRWASAYLSVSQLKIMQEMITLSVFLPLSIFVFGEKFSWDYVWSALCMMGAAFFAFRRMLFSAAS
nr:DMT family protein [Succinimonas amylolytica]